MPQLSCSGCLSQVASTLGCERTMLTSIPSKTEVSYVQLTWKNQVISLLPSLASMKVCLTSSRSMAHTSRSADLELIALQKLITTLKVGVIEGQCQHECRMLITHALLLNLLPRSLHHSRAKPFQYVVDARMCISIT